MRDIGLPSPGNVSYGLGIRTLAAQVISRLETAAGAYPSKKHPHAERVAVFFDACATACRAISAGIAPVNTVAPAVTGTAKVGSVLTRTQGTFTGTAPITYVTAWLANGVVIPGATAATYTPVVGDIGKTIRARVTATNLAGTVVALSNTTVAVVA